MKRLLIILGFLVASLCILTVRSNQAQVKATSSYPVHNIDTHLNYTNIQAAIDDNRTVPGNTIIADAGTYYEHVTVTKSLSLFGQSRNTTIIDGNGTGPVITLSADSVLIANFTIRNGGNAWIPQDTCIWGHGFSNVLVENDTVMEASNGIIFYGMHNSSMSHNIAEECGVMGLHFDTDSNCKMVGNIAENSFQGIVLEKSVKNSIQGNKLMNDNLSMNLYASAGNSVEGNNFINSTVGMVLDACNGSNNFRTNNMIGGTCNLIVWGSSAEAFMQNIDTSNIVDNKTVYYITDSHSLLLNSSNCSNIGYLALVNCTDVTVNDIDLSNDEDGMLIAESTNITLVNVTLANAHTNITLSGLSSQPLIYGGLTFFNSDNNLVINSRIVNNSVGVCLYGSSGNVFYHNSFVDVDKPVISNFQGPGSPPSGPCSINEWDDGYPSGGNYWSDYNGVDLKMGPNQNQTGSDGIGDTPYINDENNTDRYPLMAPFNTFSAGSWNGVNYSVDIVSNSTISDFSFNATQKTISFNVAGSSSTTGFCRVTIPNALLGGPYVISVNGSGPLTLNEIPDGTHTFLYFTYKQGVRSVQIVGSVAVPEFPPVLVLPILVVLITVTLILTKTRIPRKTES